MKIRAVFFDAGETLIYRNPSLTTLSYRHLSRAGIKISRVKLSGVVSSAAAEMKPIVERGKMNDSKKWELYIKKVFKRLNIKNPALEKTLRQKLKTGTSFKAFSDAHATVDYLNAKGIKTGIISNAPAELTGILKRTGLHGKFRHIVISETAGVEKPDRRIFEKALALAKSRAHETVYIGDNYVADIFGAKNAGLVPVWVNRKSKNAEFSFKSDSRQAVRTVKSLKGLVNLMKSEGWL